MKRKLKKMMVIPLLVLMGVITAFECYARIVHACAFDYVGVEVRDIETKLAVPKLHVTGWHEEGGKEYCDVDIVNEGTRVILRFTKTGKYFVEFKAEDYYTQYMDIVIDSPKPEAEAVIVSYIGLKHRPR